MGKGVNLSGAFFRRDNPLSQLPEKPLALNAKFFRELVRRIETIVPVDGKEITVKPPDAQSPGLTINLNAKRITLNVCNNGLPDTLVVYGPKDESET